ncbi:lipoate--protein ligase family protein [Actinomadura parmotrematis]|uniref:BPL/LPL catalytic domain-containing protein n=1 Tax=Actinomadura parmotrematis TaxID=2864039 RepID=A0ABS7FZS3_9ACTN|nr:hypothetical protein [Actinomadura parmotrematis]MBW8485756.1 hypothetical protein [Actinomadura parmotrematis]
MLTVIVEDGADPAWNLALDEALLRSAAAPPGRGAWDRAGTGPLLRVWQNAPSVLIGRFQNLTRAVDLAACARDGVPVVRRGSGGGAVHTGPGTLLFSLVRPAAPRDARPPLDALVAAAVATLGPPAAALGDGTIATARMRTRHAELVQVAVHVSDVASGAAHLAAGPQPTLAGHGPPVSLDAVRAAVLCGAVEEYGIAAARRPDRHELDLQRRLHARRYGDPGWQLNGVEARDGPSGGPSGGRPHRIGAYPSARR